MASGSADPPACRGSARGSKVATTAIAVAAAVAVGTYSTRGGGPKLFDVDPDAQWAHASGRRLSTSSKCRQALEAMLSNDDWNFFNVSYTKWCRLKAENEMARCCGIADFASGRGEDCGISKMSGEAVETECQTSCQHSNMIKLCNEYFGTACTVDRKLFKGSPLRVAETFCVPEECNNGADREGLIAWYSTLYAGRLNGWHGDWDDAVLACQSAAVGVVLYTVVAMVIACFLIVLLFFLCVGPQEHGKILMSQEEMMGGSKNEDNADTSKSALRDVGAASDNPNMSGTR